METSLRVFFVALVVIAAFFVGASIGQRSDGVGSFAGGLFGGSDEAELSSEALEVINDSYFRDVDDEALEDASVKAMVTELRKTFKDRFSHYFPPDDFSRFQELTSGRFSGVGLSVNEVKQGLRVATVFEDSPAEEAGIEEGDIVTAVNGKSIAGEDAELATGKIKGNAGTTVTLSVLRPSTGEARDYKLERRDLVVPAVEGKLEQASGRPVGYIRLLGFSRGAHAELREAVDRLDERGAEGLVVDLRGNGGGLLDEAVLTSSVFVEDGVIVSTKGRTQPEKTFEAAGDAVSPRPIVVLINGDTASASEIFTAALSDAGLAQVAGETSFGKGVFQEVIELDNGGALDLTVGEYLTRDGVSLAGAGIEPELPAVDLPKSKPDEGLQAALAALGASLSEQPE
ncbi:MAG: S41 family peptidase [Actinomycetota bacterium]|nr:S41 family peptidase [Actinomycetota bacterium]